MKHFTLCLLAVLPLLLTAIVGCGSDSTKATPPVKNAPPPPPPGVPSSSQ